MCIGRQHNPLTCLNRLKCMIKFVMCRNVTLWDSREKKKIEVLELIKMFIMSLLLLHSKLVFSHYVLIAWATWSLNHPPSCNLRHNKHFEITGLSPFCVHLLKISSINIYLLLIIVKDRKIVSISTRTYWVFVLFF